MPISFHCRSCRAKITIPDGAAGRWVTCPACQSKVVVPGEMVDTATRSQPVATLPQAIPVHPLEIRQTKECPLCNESILIAARKCKHCGEIIDPALRFQIEQAKPQQIIQVITNNDNASQSVADATAKAASTSKAVAISDGTATLAGCAILLALFGFCGLTYMGCAALSKKEAKPSNPPAVMRSK